MPVCLCLCTFIEIRRGTKNLDLVLCTVVYIVKSGGAGWDKRREQKMPVSFVFAFAGRQAGIKGRSKKCLLVCVCICWNKDRLG